MIMKLCAFCHPFFSVWSSVPYYFQSLASVIVISIIKWVKLPYVLNMSSKNSGKIIFPLPKNLQIPPEQSLSERMSWSDEELLRTSRSRFITAHACAHAKTLYHLHLVFTRIKDCCFSLQLSHWILYTHRISHI